MAAVLESHARLLSQYEAVVVEGAGGFIVPLCEPDPDLGGDWVTSASAVPPASKAEVMP